MGRLTALVSELAISVVLGVAAGAWVDDRLSTSPVFTLLLTLAGLTLGMVRLITTLQADTDDDADPPPDRP
jgi:F0F1-type ATP synthase assembly protein I